MDASIIRLSHRDRVIVPVGANVDQFIPIVTSRAHEEASSLVDLGVDYRKYDSQPAISASPHGALPSVYTYHSAARYASQQQEG